MKLILALFALVCTSCSAITPTTIMGGLQDVVGLCTYVEQTTIKQLNLAENAKSGGSISVTMEYCSDGVLEQEAYVIYSVQEHKDGSLVERRDVLVNFEKKGAAWKAVGEKKFFGRIHINNAPEAPKVSPEPKFGEDVYGY